MMSSKVGTTCSVMGLEFDLAIYSRTIVILPSVGPRSLFTHKEKERGVDRRLVSTSSHLL